MVVDALQKAAAEAGIRVPLKEEEGGVRAVLDEIDEKESPSPIQRVAMTIEAMKEIWGCDSSHSEAQEFRAGITLRKILKNRLTLYGNISHPHVASYGGRKYKPRPKPSADAKREAAWQESEKRRWLNLNSTKSQLRPNNEKALSDEEKLRQPVAQFAATEDEILKVLQEARDGIRFSNRLQIFRAQPFIHDLGAQLRSLF